MNHRLEGLAQRFVVTRAVSGAPNGVQLQLPPAKADLVEQRRQHFQHFDVARRRFAACAGRSDDLGPNLEELAVASLLRTLAAKLWPDVIELLERTFLVEPVLDVSAHHAGRILGAQSQRLRLFAGGATLVLPGKHLLGDDVGFFADAAREQAGIFKYRRADFVEVVACEHIAHLRLDPIPQVGVGRQKVTGSADGSNHRF